MSRHLVSESCHFTTHYIGYAKKHQLSISSTFFVQTSFLCLEFGFKRTFTRKMRAFNVDEIDSRWKDECNETAYFWLHLNPVCLETCGFLYLFIYLCACVSYNLISLSTRGFDSGNIKILYSVTFCFSSLWSLHFFLLLMQYRVLFDLM